MYRLVSFANFARRPYSLLVPVFSAPNQNVPYVQVMNCHFDVTALVPYYLLEAAAQHEMKEELSLDVRSPGIIAFVMGDGEPRYGNIHFVRKWVMDNLQTLTHYPLLSAQLIRITKIGIGEKYNVLAAAAPRIFDDQDAAKQWLQGELTLLQKDAQIWNAIERNERIKRTGTEWRNPIAELSAIDRDNLILWLSDFANFDNPHWARAWFSAEVLTSGIAGDERLFVIATNWLHYLVGSGGTLGKAGPIINRIVQFSQRAIPKVGGALTTGFARSPQGFVECLVDMEIEFDDEVNDGENEDSEPLDKTIGQDESAPQLAIGTDHKDFNDLLFVMFEDGTIFNREVAVTEANIEAAFFKAIEPLSQYEINRVLRLIVSRYNLYERELVFFILHLAESMENLLRESYDFDEDQIRSVVASMGDEFFRNSNVARFNDNDDVKRGWLTILRDRELLAERFECQPLTLQRFL